MSICDKINTVGNTLETNLNARGVSCTFGTGTGEKTILDMVNLITSSNLKGSSDAVISISASRPYLLSGEKTDLIVRLADGLGQPLANKSVSISDGTSVYSGITNIAGFFVLYDLTISADTTFTATYSSVSDTCKVKCAYFIDYGVTNNKNDTWDTWGSYTVSRTRSVESTLIEPVDRTTASYQIKYISNMSSPSIIEFDCCQVGGATNSVIFQLRGNNQSVIRQIALSSYTNLSLGEWYHWKVDLVNGKFTNETTNQTLTFSTGSIISFFFVIQANAQHNLKYKNFVIY